MAKHIFVTGGVVSSLGKGLTAASIGMLLKRRGYKVAMQKMDPYLNIDPGTMSPYQHGEVFVTDSGSETDLDLGHYERFLATPCGVHANYTTGKIFSVVLERERAGGYLGKTVQVIPHITDEIKRAIRSIGEEDYDIVITEIGGTVGDIESQPYLEAIRQFQYEAGEGNAIFIHLTLVPYIRAAGEMKTKPSQQSVAILQSVGIRPHMLICRCERPFAQEHRDKLALFCNVPADRVIEECDVEHSIYEVPLELRRQEVDEKVLKLLDLPVPPIDLSDWNAMLDRLLRPQNGSVEIAVVGKYIELRDAYKSIYEALAHAATAHSVKLNLRYIESEEIEAKGASTLLAGVHGVLVPGGFGTRGVEGKIAAIEYARTQKIPFFGICLGLQCTVIEYARHVMGLDGANSTEVNPDTPHPVVLMLSEQTTIKQIGATMRLGAYPCQLQQGTKAYDAYGVETISERHRHRYEISPDFVTLLKQRQEALQVVGTSPNGEIAEVVELRDHPWFVACQFHPEFKSEPVHSHPLFKAFIGAAVNNR